MGYPHLDLGWGTHSLDLGWGIPLPGPGLGYPLDLGWYSPHLDLGWGTFHLDLGWGTFHLDLGYPSPGPRMGYLPNWTWDRVSPCLDLGWGIPPHLNQGWGTPPIEVWTDKLKTVPSPILRMRAVKMWTSSLSQYTGWINMELKILCLARDKDSIPTDGSVFIPPERMFIRQDAFSAGTSKQTNTLLLNKTVTKMFQYLSRMFLWTSDWLCYCFFPCTIWIP